MKPLVRILAATDLSAPARHAVNRGFHIAAATHARYTVMHASELDALDSLTALLGGSAPSVKQHLLDAARETLREMLADPLHNQGIEADARVVCGTPLKSVSDEADALDADLLVLGARGESFLRHAMFGSTASRLLRKSIRRPVLIVKQAPHEAYRRLLISVDFSPVSLSAIRFARQLAPTAKIILLHAFELPFEGKLAFAGVEPRLIEEYIFTERNARTRQAHQLAEEAKLAPAEYCTVVIHGDPAQQIAAQEQEQDCDLIVMGKHGMHLIEELLLGSVTKHVLAESQCDVLVVT